MATASPTLLALPVTETPPHQTAPYVPRTSSILRVVTAGNVTKVWMPDKQTGTRLVCLSSSNEDAAAPLRVSSSTPSIPSGRRIHSIMATTGNTSGEAQLASDDLGNVYVLGAGEEPDVKRTRVEGAATGSASLQWSLTLGARDHLPQRGCLPAYGTPSGWVGLRSFGALMGCSREHFLDTRIFDMDRGTIVKTIQHMHGPTASTSVQGLGDNIGVFAEGPLLSAFDVRVPTARAAINRSSLPIAASFTHVVDLGPQRPHEVATCSSDRSVIIWDVRNWTRAVTLSAVLKHATMSATPLQGGKYLVCSGIDSEVRVCSTTPPPPAPKQQAASATGDTESLPPVSSFRNRISETEHCESTWHGTWASDAEGSTAVGMAITGETYVARACAVKPSAL